MRLEAVVFRVLEGHPQEAAFDRMQRAVDSVAQHLQAERLRARVVCEGSSRPTEEVSRELVEQDHEREKTLGRSAAIVALAARGGLELWAKKTRRGTSKAGSGLNQTAWRALAAAGSLVAASNQRWRR